MTAMKAQEEEKAAKKKAHEEKTMTAMKAQEEKKAATTKAQEEKTLTAMKALEEKKAAKHKAREEKEKVTNTTVCHQQYQENYHNGPKEMPIVVPMGDAMLDIIGPLREGQFHDTHMLQV